REHAGEITTRREGVMHLGERHRTAVIPDVQHLWHAMGLATAVGTGNPDVVDVRTVRIEILADDRRGQLAQTCKRADDLNVSTSVTPPKRQWGAPLALARD